MNITFVFQHKIEANKIKMVDAEGMKEAWWALEKRLLVNSIIINGTVTHESINDYQYYCTI